MQVRVRSSGTSKPSGPIRSQSSENSEKIKAERREEVGGEGRVAGVVLQERDRKSLGRGEGGGNQEERGEGQGSFNAL